MSGTTTSFITPQEYLARERIADFRSEYYRGEVFAMAVASFGHTLIKDIIAAETGNQSKGTSCVALTSDMRVKVDATGLYTYPDVVIVCEEPKFEDEEHDTLLNPQVVIEVLSDSTEKYDRGAKSGQYRRIATMKEYVLVAQDRPLVERYVRQAGGTWLLTVFDDLSKTFEFGTVKARLPMAEIFRGIQFAEDAGR